jgi:hypothetical protein
MAVYKGKLRLCPHPLLVRRHRRLASILSAGYAVSFSEPIFSPFTYADAWAGFLNREAGLNT